MRPTAWGDRVGHRRGQAERGSGSGGQSQLDVGVGGQVLGVAQGQSLPFSTPDWFRTPSGKADLLPLPTFVAPRESRNGAAATAYRLLAEALQRRHAERIACRRAALRRHPVRCHPAPTEARVWPSGDDRRRDPSD